MARAIPQLPGTVRADLCPVDWVGTAVAKFGLGRRGGVHHLTAAEQTPMCFLLEQLSAVLEEEHGMAPLLHLPLRIWHHQLLVSADGAAHDHPVAAVLHFFSESSFPCTPIFRREQAAAGLAALGMPESPRVDAKMVQACLRHYLKPAGCSEADPL